ncbi:thioredoxin family protein [Edaphobacter sp. 12200R-103]|uniref:DUF1223 domain-containing protein n=1 Tax=Edaphobacter sp. 12200R-103 TaxID=2703788 RepID=UPI00138C950D|nr:DUF1223 domain-containing protein [Edaphobacter sp. 12200R-103]QHS51037.1 DUF1223 domain-containing protein [Edaphobacter sp. 12200R-103]
MILLRIFFVALLLSAGIAPARSQTASTGTPVLVELFTSEGCSSCPPADKLLGVLQTQQPVPGAHIVAVEEHVDYWDRQGWRDRFSSARFTQRQGFYAPRLNFEDSYTPQMVVDGATQFLGSDSSKAFAVISQAAQKEKIRLTLSAPVVNGRTVAGSVSVQDGAASLPHGDLYAVLIQPSASTEVKGGENGGKQLSHVSVARAFARVGKIGDLSHGPVDFKITAPAEADPAGMRLILFAQLPSQGAVRGIAEATIPTSR